MAKSVFSPAFYRFLLAGWLVCLTNAGFSQNVPVGSFTDASLRADQLVGMFDSQYSFTIRPVRPRNDSAFSPYNALVARKLVSFGKKGGISLLPARWTQQFNSHHPYGWNDGSMISAKGYQTVLSTGVYASAGPLEVQLMPEFVYAASNGYESSPAYGQPATAAYQKLFPGQSYVKLSALNMSIGLSTENLWWGPGIRSSLLMSNNAPGFLHGFIRSKTPMKTPIGSFEWELIGGKLTSDPGRVYENFQLSGKPAESHPRYLNALVVTYQPKWTPGLFLGIARALQRQTNDLGLLSGSTLLDKYLPILFKPVEKQATAGDDSLRTDQLASFFLRWVFPKAHVEIYAEYGYNDYGYNTRDYLLGPTHSAAYLAGIRKVIPQSGTKRIEFGIELTQMSQSPDFMVRDAGNWYQHAQVLDGYTHQNQIIGAGAGLGSNVLSIDLAWVNGWKRLGFVLERVNRNPVEYTHKWIDLGLGFLPQWKYKQFLFSGLLELVRTTNYLWQPGKTRFNVHSQISVQYHF